MHMCVCRIQFIYGKGVNYGFGPYWWFIGEERLIIVSPVYIHILCELLLLYLV